MKQLEKTLEKVELKIEEIKPLYQGLQLIEDKVYQGPTSIKYWM